MSEDSGVNSPQAEFIYHQQWKTTPSGVYFSHRKKLNPRQSSSSPAMVIHPQPRLFLQISRSSRRVSLFPTESFSHHFILQQSYSPANLFSNHLRSLSPARTKNSTPCTLQQQSGIYFPLTREHHKNIAYLYIMAYAYASYSTISFILRASLPNALHAS